MLSTVSSSDPSSDDSGGSPSPSSSESPSGICICDICAISPIQIEAVTQEYQILTHTTHAIQIPRIPDSRMLVQRFSCMCLRTHMQTFFKVNKHMCAYRMFNARNMRSARRPALSCTFARVDKKNLREQLSTHSLLGIIVNAQHVFNRLHKRP